MSVEPLSKRKPPTGDEREVLSPPIDDGLLSEMCRRILTVVDAERIVLFGSHAYGETTEDSDIDLLVIVDSDESPFRLSSRLHRRLSPRLVSLDIIVRTPKQIADALNLMAGGRSPATRRRRDKEDLSFLWTVSALEKLGETKRDKIFDRLANDLGMDKDSLSNRYYALLRKLR